MYVLVMDGQTKYSSCRVPLPHTGEAAVNATLTSGQTTQDNIGQISRFLSKHPGY